MPLSERHCGASNEVNSYFQAEIKSVEKIQVKLSWFLRPFSCCAVSIYFFAGGAKKITKLQCPSIDYPGEIRKGKN